MSAEGIVVSAVIVFFLFLVRYRGRGPGPVDDAPEIGSRSQFWWLLNPASLTLVAMTAAIGAIAVVDQQYAIAGISFTALIASIALRLFLVSKNR